MLQDAGKRENGCCRKTLFLHVYIHGIRNILVWLDKTYTDIKLLYCERENILCLGILVQDAGAAIAVRATSATLCNFGHPMQHGLFFVVFVCGGLLPVALILIAMLTLMPKTV